MITYILFAIGFVFLIKGADLLVEGSSSIAKKFGISNLVIGLTVVSFGTSAPELIVNIIASINGSGDIGIGNVLGSNIANIFLILGIASMIYPLKVKSNTVWKEIPLNFMAAVVLFAMANDIIFDGAKESMLGRIDGFILITFFVLFMYYTFGLSKTEKKGVATQDLGLKNETKTKKHSVSISILMTLAGIIGLALGGQWVVNGAIIIATKFGLSEALIGLTIVAIGTSLPELATSAMAAYKKNADIAIGNVVGSNLFNIFWVLGISAMIKPLPFSEMINTDILVYTSATILLFAFMFIGKKHRLYRTEGVIFLTAYASYIVFLVIRG